MAETSMDILIEALQDRDIPYDRDAIKSAFAERDSKIALEGWIMEYLSTETLLTKDEATLYAVLVKSGEADKLAAQDLSHIEGLNDHELQIAIEELKRSTAAIEKQSEALRLQQNAMASLVKSGKRSKQTRSHTNQSQVRKWDVERGHISHAVEELSQGLKYQIADLELQFKSSETSMKQNVDSILKSDDKLLLSLQKLASDLDPGLPEDNAMEPKIRDLCARLIKYTVEGIRTRLDRIYLENLRSSSRSQTLDNSEQQEIADLQEELESLYSELLPVAQMSVEQQFLEPALRTIASSSGQGQERSIKAVKYINDCLVFLVNRIETFLERAEESQSHKIALKFVLESAKTELNRPEAPTGIQSSSPVKSNTQRRRQSSASKASGRPRSIHRRSSGDGDIEPEQQLARTMGITLPDQTYSDHERVDALERMLTERLTRLEGHAATLQSTTENSISSHLLDARTTFELLQNSLLLQSQYKRVHLLDPELKSSVTKFERNIANVQQELEAMDLNKLQSRNVHREQLLQRWSR